MKYTQGSLGRVFVAKLDDGEAIYDAVLEIARREGIRSAAVMAVGGIRRGKAVTGPEDPNAEVVPRVTEFDDARELVGFGTIFPLDGKPSLHMHAGIGDRDHVMIGCPRIEASVYLVLEVVIIELLGIEAAREFDPKWAVHVLSMLGDAGR